MAQYDPNDFKYYLSIAWGIIILFLYKIHARWNAKRNDPTKQINGAIKLGTYKNEYIYRILYIVGGIVFILIGLIGLGKC